MTESLQGSWEKRAHTAGTSLSGVLFRGLSEQANAAVHLWHAWIVAEVFAPFLAPRGNVLDLGCGYGRLSGVLAQSRADCTLVGQDLAMAYGKLYRKNIAPCVCAEAEHIPFIDGRFDGVLAVTVLMYAERARVAQLLTEIHRVVAPGGSVLLLDPGLGLQQWIARVRRNRDRSPTGGSGFGLAEYRRLVEHAGFRITHEGGNPWLSAALLVPGVRGSSKDRVAHLLSDCARRDCRAGGYSAFALHRWIRATRL